MSNDPTVFDPDRAIAAMKRIHEEAKNVPNPAEAIYAPGAKVNILSKGTPEWEERQKRDAQWLVDNPRPKPAPIPYHVQPDGTWEQRFATEGQLAQKRVTEDKPTRTFKAVVFPGGKRFALREGSITKYFATGDILSAHCRRQSKGERASLEYYKMPGASDQWYGDDFGDFIYSESFA
jgi:hypothetical protein